MVFDPDNFLLEGRRRIRLMSARIHTLVSTRVPDMIELVGVRVDEGLVVEGVTPVTQPDSPQSHA